jgi:hypothetical protein
MWWSAITTPATAVQARALDAIAPADFWLSESLPTIEKVMLPNICDG